MLRLFLTLTFLLRNNYATFIDPYEILHEHCNLHPKVPCPTCWRTGPTSVETEVRLQRFIDIDAISQSFTFSGAVVTYWYDECSEALFQNSTLWPNKLVYYLDDREKLWSPDLIHLNSLTNEAIKGGNFEFRNNLVVPTGEMTMVLYGSFQSFCDLDFKHFPFDVQTCSFIYSYGTSTPVISTTILGAHLDFNAMPENSNWEIIDLYINKTIHDQSFKMVIVCKRNPAFFIINLYLLTLVLSILEIVSFFIPTEYGGDRPTFAATVMLSMLMIHSQALGYIPKTPRKVPISIFVIGTIAHATSCVIYASLSVLLAHSFPKTFEKTIKFLFWKKTVLTTMDILAFVIASITLLVLNLSIMVECGAFDKELEPSGSISRLFVVPE